MSDTLYSPPTSDVGSGLGTDDERFYVVGIRKYVVLSIATLNLYHVYWFWRNWRDVRDRDGEDLWPIPRALFSVFFTHSLFRKVDDSLRSSGQRYAWSAQGTANAVVLLTVVSNVSSNFTNRLEDLSPFVDVAVMGMSLLIPFATVPAQRAVNTLNGDPEGTANDGLSLANWLWMIPGALFWILILVGFAALFVGEPAV